MEIFSIITMRIMGGQIGQEKDINIDIVVDLAAEITDDIVVAHTVGIVLAHGAGIMMNHIWSLETDRDLEVDILKITHESDTTFRRTKWENLSHNMIMSMK
jgi:ABC-type ATPase with predicted acetyltransferase domain